jgi:hypothetical protein
MEKNIMDEPIHIFTVRKTSKSLNTYVDCSGEGYCFEVKDGDRLFYRGDSFEKATQTYENLLPEATL